ncbi:hypothetical protein ACS0TY_010666 [Phlomoides rotata]
MDFSICPFCNLSIPSLELQRHANDHFSDENEDRDLQLALRNSILPPSPPRAAEDSLKCKPGYRFESSSSSCDAKVTSFGGNTNDKKWASLICSQRKEIFYIVEDGLMALLRKCLELESEYSTSVLCGHIDHFQGKSWDVGWGCGWRNIQMLSSHLIRQQQEARDILYGGSGFVPDIGSLQQWLELAWAKGYDTPGSEEFDQKIYDPRLSFKKRKNLQVHGPMDVFLSKGKLDMSTAVSSGKEGFRHSGISSVDVNGHHVLSEWVWNYFSSNNSNKSGNHHVVLSEKAPLYFQHDGHSRTIVGIQAKHQKNGTRQYNLLILDPAEFLPHHFPLRIQELWRNLSGQMLDGNN